MLLLVNLRKEEKRQPTELLAEGMNLGVDVSRDVVLRLETEIHA